MRPDPRPLRLAKRLWYRAAHATRSAHEVHAHLCGLDISFSSRSRIGEEIFANAFERNERMMIAEIMKPGDTVIDVGANVGFYSCLFARRVGTHGQVLAFEPTPT